MHAKNLTRQLTDLFVLALFLLSSFHFQPVSVAYADSQPYLTADMTNAQIIGSNFTAGASITVQLYRSEGGVSLHDPFVVSPDSTGSFTIFLADLFIPGDPPTPTPIDLRPGYQVVADQDNPAVHRSLIVADVSLKSIIYAQDSMAGTATAGAIVQACSGIACNPSRTVTAGPDGSWTASFSGAPDLHPGDTLYAQVLDADGDYTITYNDTHPFIELFVPNGLINLYNFTPNSTVKLYVFDQLNNQLLFGQLPMDNHGNNFRIYPGGSLKYEVGYKLVATDPVLGDKNLDVTRVSLTGVDTNADTISGLTDANVTILGDVRAGDVVRSVFSKQAGANGIWSIAGAELEMSIASATDIRVSRMDADGDLVSARLSACYSLTAGPNNADYGTVNILTPPNCGGNKYISDTLVRLSASAAPAYSFINWSGDPVSVPPPPLPDPTLVTINLDRDKSVTANFSTSATCYTLSTLTDPAAGGSASITTPPTCGFSRFISGTAPSIKATANSSYVFKDWLSSSVNSPVANPLAANTTVSLNSDTTVTAEFTPCYTLTTGTIPASGGSVRVLTAPNCGASQYLLGTVVSIQASTNTGFLFDHWQGTVANSTAASTTVTMTADQSVTANYTYIEYSLTLNITGSGTVTPSPNQATYHYGDVVALTATGDPGWSFSSWHGALTGTTNPASITIHGNTTISATFTQDGYTLTINKVGSGTVAHSPVKSIYRYGDQVTLTATPATGWSLSSWSGGLTGSTNPAILTMQGNTTVTATFTRDEYTLTISKVGNGTITRNPDKATYHYGDVVVLTAAADPGWNFSGWSGGLTGSTSPASVTMHGNTTITATFTAIEFTLTINKVGSGTVTRNPDKTTYHYGEVVTLTAAPDTDFLFDGWTGPISGSNGATATVLMDGNKTVTARFAGCYTLTTSANPSDKGSVSILTAANCPSGKYKEGTQISLQASPSVADWDFLNWTGAVANARQAATTLTMSAANTTVTANFIEHCRRLNVTVDASGGGTVEVEPAPNCGSGYLGGTNITITTYPDMLNRFANWTGDATDLEFEPEFTIEMDIHRTLVAHFVPASSLIPGTVTLTAPANKALINTPNPIPLSWNEVISNMTDANRYQVQVSTSSKFKTRLIDGIYGPGLTTFNLNLSNDGNYFWRVRAVNMLGYTGKWSKIWWFKLDRTAPLAPKLLSPADAAAVNGTPNFVWRSVPTAYRYAFEITNVDTATTERVADLNSTHFKPVLKSDGNYKWKVQARDAAGNWGPWSEERSLVINPPVPLPPQVVLNSPVNKLVTHQDSLTLSWFATPYAVKYNVEWSDTSDFTGQKYAGIATGLTFNIDFNTIIPGGVPNGVYYWRVNAVNASNNAGAWSQVRSFTLDRSIPQPGAPVLKTPVNKFAFNNQVLHPDFTWTPADSYAESYNIEVANNSQFNPRLFTFSLTKPPYNVQGGDPIAALAAGTYYWRVQALNSQAPAPSKWSAVWSFTVDNTPPSAPTLVRPLKIGAVVPTLKGTPAYAWRKVPGAVSYKLQISTDSGFTTPAPYEFTTTATTYKPPMQALGHFYWRVLAIDAANNASAWSAPLGEVIVEAPIPAAPKLLLPANKFVTRSKLPRFDWTDVPYAAGYTLQVSTSSKFAPFTQFDAPASAYATTSKLTAGVYYWRVKAYNASSVAGRWSKIYTFTIDSTKPVGPVLLAPLPAARTTSHYPAFTWKKVANATSYQIEIRLVGGSSSDVLRISGLTTPSFIPPYLAVGQYQWRVRGQNAAGNWGDWSAQPRSFEIY